MEKRHMSDNLVSALRNGNYVGKLLSESPLDNVRESIERCIRLAELPTLTQMRSWLRELDEVVTHDLITEDEKVRGT
jgi:hypothetical protein